MASVALIMRSKNEQPYANRALAALKMQTFRDFRLLNCDSGSTDGTLEAIRKYSNKVFQINPEEYVPGKVLNNMISQTKEAFIVLLNADAIPQDSKWLDNLLEPLFDGNADATISRQIARPDAYFIVKYDYERGYGSSEPSKRRHCFFSAVACAFRRELWDYHKFPEAGWGEDFVWAVRCREHGYRFAIVPESIVEHSHNYPLKVLFRREYGHGIVHYHELGEKPRLLSTLLSWSKHLTRDVLYATRHGRFDTIIYNLAYRTVFNLAHYMGRKAASKGKGFGDVFFRN